MASRAVAILLPVTVFTLAAAAPAAARDAESPPPGWAADVPDVAALVALSREESDLRTAIIRYVEDKAAIERRYPVLHSPVRTERLRRMHAGWQERLEALDFDALNAEGQVDYILLRNRIAHDLDALRLAEQHFRELSPLVPFADAIRELEEQRLDRERVEPRAAADVLASVAETAGELAAELESGEASHGVSATVAMRAGEYLDHLREMLGNWHAFYDGYDPLFTWWMRKPQAAADSAIAAYAAAIRQRLVGMEPGKPPPIVGDPVLAEGLQADLAVEMIPYSAAELIHIGQQEFAWIVNELEGVARDMGFGDDWKAALEHTKNLAPPPGEIPWVLYDIASYSEAFIERMNVIDLPPLSREIWRFTMQTPERQLVNPFFSGGEVTHVSYPADSMEHDQKMMSMRGNTPHFNFPTVQHELVPGHHLQSFMYRRFNGHRAALNRTPFWQEGWALYWEFALWDRDFARNDADRVGMLFWRLHRAGRIIFSLNFQLGNWSPQECIDFLVNEVGHERANAEAEVRRTARDAPLYQAAYMLGALQIRALHRELVGSGRMSAEDFHNGFLLGGPMPVEMVRARLAGQPLSRDYRSEWRFYGDAGN